MEREETKIKILLVEDLKIAQKVAALTLAQLNCVVDTADTGVEALERFKTEDYALVFMDLGLPDIDGLTVTETMRREEKNKGRKTTIPIVALTAHSNDEILKRHCFEAGISDFLVKPLMLEHAEKILNKFCTPSFVSVL